MHRLLLPLIFIFCFSCAKPTPFYPELPSTKAVAYAQVETAKHTKRIQRQQRDICDRLKKIQNRLEKTKKRVKKK
jgi:hypothetical protein